MDGAMVPNEAYFFTLEAETADHSQQAVYDPITFSGGEPFESTQVKLDRKLGRIAYQLSQPSRVLIRIGMSGHALLKTLVDWEPRPAGELTEDWNGKGRPQNSSPAIALERLDQLKERFQRDSDQVCLIALLSPN
jgi:hypothetical protein